MTKDEFIAELDRIIVKMSKLRDWFTHYRDPATAAAVFAELTADMNALAGRFAADFPHSPTAAAVPQTSCGSNHSP